MRIDKGNSALLERVRPLFGQSLVLCQVLVFGLDIISRWALVAPVVRAEPGANALRLTRRLRPDGPLVLVLMMAQQVASVM